MSYLDLSIEYGDQILEGFFPEGLGNLQVIESPGVDSEITDLPADLRKALENPVDSPPLKNLVAEHYPGSGKKILLLADDNTRPNIHTRMIYPYLLRYLQEECQVDQDDIGILIASGTHRPPTEDEIRQRILGEEIFEAYRGRILIHNDQGNLADLGFSSNGTPITINQDALNACLLIPVTDSEYHYFAGVAGTVKQLFPGIAGRITTNTNHTRMFDKQAGFKPVCRLGNTEGNPVITDMKEMARLVQNHVPVFALDAIMDHGQITALNAGSLLSLHELANQLLRDRRVIEVDKAGDLVIISVGKLGINLFQAGKGINAAWNAAKKPGGTLLVLAPCPDGVGSDGYQETMQAVEDLDLNQALEWIIDNRCSVDTFRIGNQKPVDSVRIMKSLGDGRVNILTEMDPQELKKTYRLNALPDLGSPLASLRGFLEGYLEKKPDALVYLVRDTGLYIVPREN